MDDKNKEKLSQIAVSRFARWRFYISASDILKLAVDCSCTWLILNDVKEQIGGERDSYLTLFVRRRESTCRHRFNHKNWLRKPLGSKIYQILVTTTGLLVVATHCE